jgi:hypothetical protein
VNGVVERKVDSIVVRGNASARYRLEPRPVSMEGMSGLAVDGQVPAGCCWGRSHSLTTAVQEKSAIAVTLQSP